MRTLKIICLILLLTFSFAAPASGQQADPVVITDHEDGYASASGAMLSARIDKSNAAAIGCGIKVFDDFAFGDPVELFTGSFMFCQAEDAQGNYAVCESENTDLYQALYMLADYSRIRFTFEVEVEDEVEGRVERRGTCTRVDVSTQSFYLPFSDREKAGK